MSAEISEVDTTTLTPTDISTTFSVTLDSSRSRSNNSKDCLDITRDELEKKQFLHTIQLLRLELSQKQLVIDTAHSEQASQLEELKEQLADARHEKKLLSLRVQSLTHGYEQELKRTRDKLREERARVGREIGLQQNAEAAVESIRYDLDLALSTEPFIDEAQYSRLKSADSASLPLRDFVQLRLYDFMKQTQRKSQDMQRNIDQLSQHVRSREEELSSTKENLLQVSDRASKLDEECSHLHHELKLVKTQVLEGNYKVDNFDSVKRERDSLRKELDEMRGVLEGAQARDQLAVRELDKLTKELSTSQQSEALLLHDKDYLSRQVGELTQRLSVAEERSTGASQEVASLKMAREELSHQLIKCREEKHVECEHRLESELEGLRARTAAEMDQLRTQTREMYEREGKVLCEARDMAASERDRARATERETADKYEQLLKEHHSLQGSADSRLAELQAEVQVARFEKERVSLVHQETLKDLRQLQLDQEKQQRKVELLSQELWTSRSDKELQLKRLETQLQDTQQRLLGYEKIEKELDDIVMQSAEMEHSCDAERVLFSYGFGTSVPTHSKRRLQQSVQLARRVLQLEKINVSLRDQLKAEEVKTSKLNAELAHGREMLQGVQQPHGYLMSRVKEQRAELERHKARVCTLEGELEAMQREKGVLVETKNQMAADLERLLNHREELHLMKMMLLNGRAQRTHHHHPPHHHTTNLQPTDSAHQPRPTVFTKQFQ